MNHSTSTERHTTFAERVWPVIDVYARVQRAVEAENRARQAAASATA